MQGEDCEHPANGLHCTHDSEHVMPGAKSGACLIGKLALAGEVHDLGLAPEVNAFHEVLQHYAATGTSAYAGNFLLFILQRLQALKT